MSRTLWLLWASRTSAEAETTRGTADEPQLPQSLQSPAWGPMCPDPALRAWGQKIVNEMQSIHETHVFPVASPPANDDESERMVIGRLIRRMRISDSPTRFQGLATSVLKTSLGMAAVAWVPREGHEPVVVSGGIEGIRPSRLQSIPAGKSGRPVPRGQRGDQRRDEQVNAPGAPVRHGARRRRGLARRGQSG